MANQAYNGQPVNISFDYEGEGPLDSKLVQLSETAAKDPTTWLKNGIYRIGNGQPVFTQEGKLLQYIGRNGNATDIADDTKWKEFATTADIQAAISDVTGTGFSYQGNTATVPANPVNKGMYRASAAFTIPAASCLSGSAEKVTAGDMLIAIEVDGANDTKVIKWSVLQNNIDTESLAGEFVTAGQFTATSNVMRPILFGDSPNGRKIAETTQISAIDLDILMQEFKGTSTTPYGSSRWAANDNTLLDLLNKWYGPDYGYAGYQKSRYNTHKHFLDNFEKIHMLAMVDTGIQVGTDEDAFIAAVQALQSNTDRGSETRSYPSPLEFVMFFGWDNTNDELDSNFFGFTKSMPYIRGLWQKGRGNLKGTIHFRNYDLEGTLSSPCVEYTYDLDTKTLSYQKLIEVTVS